MEGGLGSGRGVGSFGTERIQRYQGKLSTTSLSS